VSRIEFNPIFKKLNFFQSNSTQNRGELDSLTDETIFTSLGKIIWLYILII